MGSKFHQYGEFRSLIAGLILSLSATSSSPARATPFVVSLTNAPQHRLLLTASFAFDVNSSVITSSLWAGQDEPNQVNKDDDAEIKAIVNQVLPKLRQIQNVELDFIRLICDDLTIEQRAVIKSAARKGLNEAAIRVAEYSRQLNRGGLQKKLSQPNPISSIREAIDPSVRSVVNAEQLIRYATEYEKRIDFHRQAAIDNVVSRLDEQLFLSESQCCKIKESLHQDWKVGWETWMLMSNFVSTNHLPSLPTKSVSQHLSKAQSDTWNIKEPAHYYWWWWNHPPDQIIEDDPWWNDEHVADATQLQDVSKEAR